jgi:chromosome segregation ATPase
LYEGAYSIDYAKYRKIASDKDSSEKEVADAKQKIASIEAQVRAGYQTAYDTATSSIRDLEEKRDRKTAAINVDGYKVKEKPTPAGRVGGIASLSDNLYAPLQ